ncbi:MAG: RhuM family protein, partial [Bacteroidales bacterium]|nr:RhuM family protein [Bacteroidales bacterium]
EESATCRKFRQVRQEGSRMVERELPYYNLDMIISLGYRVRSRVATHFRKWQVNTISPVEQAYLDNIKALGKKGKKEE